MPDTRWTSTRSIGVGIAVLFALPGLVACATGAGTGTSPTGSPSATSSAAPSTVATTAGVTSSSPAPQSRLAAISVARTGGLAGVRDSLVISPDGSWVFTNQKTGATQRGQLSGTDMIRLAQLGANPALAAEARLSPAKMACADSFVYDVTVGQLRLHDDECAAQGTRPVTEQLITALTGATPL